MVNTDARFLLEEKYNGAKSSEYEADLIRLREGEPLGYVIGWVPFLGTKIFLGSRPLIPRAETEYWVELAIQNIRKEKKDGVITCLDLFAGSGAIGVAVLKAIPQSKVDFGEIEEKHFSTIFKNVLKNDVEEKRTRIVKTNVWSNIHGSYDYIFTNPPYLSEGRRDRIEASVIAYEPKKALFADGDGFSLIRKTVEGAAIHLKPKGITYIEHEPEHVEKLKLLARECGLKSETFRDQYGVYRYSVFSMA